MLTVDFAPGGVVMKNNRMNAANFALLPFGPSELSGGNMTTVPASTVWEAAVSRDSQPFALYRNFGKRLFDIFFILLTLPFSVTLILCCALALWIEGGNPFYTQTRLGRNGRRFTLLKMRTMVRNADAMLETCLANDPALRREWDSKQKLQSDPRITPVGHILRSTSLDELPQLLNVLWGDMSLVGPRPMLPEQLGIYGDATQYFAVSPGVTGLWQVSTRNNESFKYRNGVDGAYETALSLKLDLTILIKTVGVVLRRTGC